jgi:hypothetical protein
MDPSHARHRRPSAGTAAAAQTSLTVGAGALAVSPPRAARLKPSSEAAFSAGIQVRSGGLKGATSVLRPGASFPPAV